MYRIFRIFFIIALLTGGCSTGVFALTDTLPEPSVSVDPRLLELSNQTVPQEYTIRTITVTGNKTLDAPIIISISGLNSGDKLNIPGSDNFAKAIQNLWKQNLLSNIAIYITRLEGDNIDIEINITERPRLSNYIFKGVKKGEEEDLIAKAGLVKSRVVTENVLKTAIENIRKFYVEKSYLNTKVEVAQRPDPTANNLIILYFNITRGKKIKISELEFYGNEALSDLALKKQMKGTKEKARLTLFPEKVVGPYGQNSRPSFRSFLKEKGYLHPTKIRNYLDPYFRPRFFSSAKFDKKKYEEDKEKVIARYNAMGYRDAAIESDTMYYTKSGLHIDVKVNEGHKYYFGNIFWKGNTKFSDSILNFILGIRKGDIYNVDILNKKLGKQLSAEGGDISGLYMDDGYLFFQVDPIETAVYNDTIDYEIRMREGPQATIKNVTIAGNEKTKDYVIRRELRTIPGEKFSRADIIRSTRELSQLGYFNPEKINPGVVPDYENGTVDINWLVEEKSSDQLELSAGWGGGIGLTGTLGITFNNFSTKNFFKKSAWSPLPQGDGQRLSLRAQSNGRFFQSYNFSFTEPWLGGKKRNALTLSAFYTKFSGGISVDGSTRYLITRGGVVSLGRQLRWPDDFFSLVIAANFTQYRLKDYPGLIPNLSNGLSTNLSAKITLNRSSVDNPQFPTKGSNFLLSGQFTPPYSLFNRGIINNKNPYEFVEFHKWRFTGEWFVPVGRPSGAERNKQFVFRAAAKFGFMGKYNSQLEISPFERFQVGNAGLTNNFGVLGFDIIAHRGYPVYENSNPKINPSENVQQASQFFTIFNKYTFELRYPFSLNPSSMIYGLAFFEAANGWYSFKDYNPFRLRRSVGVGMRFFLPMFGLLGFDYGIGLDRIKPGGSIRDAASFTFMLGFEPE